MTQFMLKFKNILKSPKFSTFLDFLGGTYISLFLATSFFGGFLRDAIPECHKYDAMIITTQCGSGILGTVIETILNFCSPMVGILIILIIPGPILAIIEGDIIAFFVRLLIIALIIVTAIAIIKFIKKSLIRLFKARKLRTNNSEIKTLCIALLIISPTIIIATYKFYLIPPLGSERIVKIDMWNTKLSFPRDSLREWSITPIPRRPKEIEMSLEHFQAMRRRASKTIPFATIDPVTIKIEGIVNIFVWPHHKKMSADERAAHRQSWLNQRLKAKVFGSDNVPLYKLVTPSIAGWEKYTSEGKSGDTLGEIDFYIKRNEKNEIQYIVTCREFLCADRSLGTEYYDVVIQFNKDKMPEFLNLRNSVLAFLKQHET